LSLGFVELQTGHNAGCAFSAIFIAAAQRRMDFLHARIESATKRSCLCKYCALKNALCISPRCGNAPALILSSRAGNAFGRYKKPCCVIFSRSFMRFRHGKTRRDIVPAYAAAKTYGNAVVFAACRKINSMT
jgi:hypothetical protein